MCGEIETDRQTATDRWIDREADKQTETGKTNRLAIKQKQPLHESENSEKNKSVLGFISFHNVCAL